ncbi:MAG: AraC family transcriptional regulator [Comamonadaceae bacterium]|nr:MAG: AraC family transcriptional regulator [Comamonadaceae bacterium]
MDGLLQALSGRDATYDPVGVLGDFVRLSEGTTQALLALADCSSVQFACRQLGVAERSLFRHLLKASGRSPVYWRQLARARRAAQGLRSGMPLADLATEHGYADQAHFSREMRRWFGASPQALRINSAALDAIELAGY